MFKLLNDPANRQQTKEAAAAAQSDALELLSICLMLGACVLAFIVQVQVYRNVTDDSGDYKVKMLAQQLEAAKADVEGIQYRKPSGGGGRESASGRPRDTKVQERTLDEEAEFDTKKRGI